MGNIIYIKGDLFDAPKGSILIHACNTKGRWGAGIAAKFAELFPASYFAYQDLCRKKGDALLGTCLVIYGEHGYNIACLFTSRGYGRNIDNPDQILGATESAVVDLIRQNIDDKEFHACKFNSGLFRVPWEQTVAILERTGKKFMVYEYGK